MISSPLRSSGGQMTAWELFNGLSKIINRVYCFHTRQLSHEMLDLARPY